MLEEISHDMIVDDQTLILNKIPADHAVTQSINQPNNTKLIDDLTTMKYVVGYHLPFDPTHYEVTITTKNNDEKDSITMISKFDVKSTSIFCIPFCCLSPLCRKRKTVTDHFHVTEDASTIELQSSSAFCGCIGKLEKGKTFHVIRTIQPYTILIHPKEVFVLSSTNEEPTHEVKKMIAEAVKKSESSPEHLSLRYTD